MNFLKTDWVSIDIHNEALQFVYERWGELLHSRTPVSHQAPVSGAPQILREWLEAHALLEETGFGKASLQAVEEEAFGVEVKPHGERRGTVETDRIVCKLVGDFASLRRAMKHHFSRGNAKDSLENQRKQAFIAHLLARLESQYVQEITRSMEYLIFEAGGEQSNIIEELDGLLEALVAELLAVGFADSFLRTHRKTLENTEGMWGTERERLGRFFARLTRPRSSIKVILGVQCTNDFWLRWPGDVIVAYKTVESIPDVPSDQIYAHFKRPAGVKRFVVIDLKAHDHHRASRKAHQLLQRTADLVSAEHPRPNLRVLGCTTIRQKPDGQQVAAYADRKQLQLEPILATTPSRAALRDLPGFAKDFSRANLEASSRRRIEGALRYYRISLEEAWMESGLTNLWTALEVLAPQNTGQNIIDGVAGAIAPLLGSFKVKSMTDDMTGYLIQHGFYDSGPFRKAFQDVFDSQGKIDPIRLLHALTDDRNRDVVLNLIDGSPLLARRVHKYTQYIRSGTSLAQAIYRSTRRMEWQVRRLYRLRNEIVHGAATPYNAQRILQHLLLFVNRTIFTTSELLMSDNGLRTIEQVMAVVDTAFHHWITRIRKQNELAKLDYPAFEEIYKPPFKQYIL